MRPTTQAFEANHVSCLQTFNHIQLDSHYSPSEEIISNSLKQLRMILQSFMDPKVIA
jgi:hypothetical protein